MNATAPIDLARILELTHNYGNQGFAMFLEMFDLSRHFVRAKGCQIFDAKDTKYLDFLSAFGVLNLGHNPKAVKKALLLAIQSDLPLHMQANLCESEALLSKLLCDIAPGKMHRVFLCNSGAEGVEAAIKMARLATKKSVILSIVGGFHGKTLGALSATPNERYQAPFRPLVPGFEAVAFGDLNALEKRLKKGDVAGLIIEPVMGEGGVILHPEGYLKEAERVCRENGALFILDEIQTGFGRTGRFFAAEHFGLSPDIIVLSKSLSGGYVPIGALLYTEKVSEMAHKDLPDWFLHTNTFGGNTLACVGALVAITEMERQKIWEKAERQGAYLLEKLQAIAESYPAIITEVRGIGLMIGMELVRREEMPLEESGSLLFAKELMARNIVSAYTINRPWVIRVAPPLIVRRSQCDFFFNALEDTLKHFQKQGAPWKS